MLPFHWASPREESAIFVSLRNCGPGHGMPMSMIHNLFGISSLPPTSHWFKYNSDCVLFPCSKNRCYRKVYRISRVPQGKICHLLMLSQVFLQVIVICCVLLMLNINKSVKTEEWRYVSVTLALGKQKLEDSNNLRIAWTHSEIMCTYMHTYIPTYVHIYIHMHIHYVGKYWKAYLQSGDWLLSIYIPKFSFLHLCIAVVFQFNSPQARYSLLSLSWCLMS